MTLCSITCELAATLVEFLLHMELRVCVNIIAQAWSKPARLIKDDISGALSISVAAVEAITAGSALVGAGSEGVLVRLHYVEFRASIPANIRTITVLERIVIIM